MSLQEKKSNQEKRWPVLAGLAFVLLMAACFARIAIHFSMRIFPGWDASGMLWLCLFGGLEAMLSYWTIKRLPTAERRLGYYRVTEWTLLFLVTKVFTEARSGFDHLWINILSWPQDFPFRILTGDLILNILLLFITWQICTAFVADLYALQSEEAYDPESRTQMPPLRKRILQRFLTVGMLIVVLGGLAKQQIIFRDLPPAPGSLLGPVFWYFLSGIVLLSLTRYASLVTLWQMDAIAVPAQVPRRWFLYASLSLACLAILAVWLPANYGLGLLDTFHGILEILSVVISFIFAIVVLFFGTIARFFGSLFGLQASTDDSGEPAGIPEPTLIQPGSALINWELIRSLLFWGVLLALAFIALRQYIGYNRDLFDELKGLGPLRFLQAAWKKFITAARQAGHRTGRFVREQIDRLRGSSLRPGTDSWQYVNLRRLSPRQKVIFYYLALVRRASEAGLSRQAAQTPLEYNRVLQTRLEAETEPLDQMTEAFLEARYSRHTIQESKAARARSLWEQLRKSLRSLRKQKEE